jgi:hypothetical protein
MQATFDGCHVIDHVASMLKATTPTGWLGPSQPHSDRVPPRNDEGCADGTKVVCLPMSIPRSNA